MTDLQPLIDLLLNGDHVGALVLARRLRAAGVGSETLITEGVERAMAAQDDKCTVERFNLLQIMLTGRAVAAVVNDLYPEGFPPGRARATVAIATLEGDVHDLGKNIVRNVLMGMGYRVVDCGKDCPVVELVESAGREAAAAVLVSGLMTTVIPQVREVRARLRERGLERLPVVAGGAALKQATAQELAVDYVAENAFDGAREIERLLERAS